MGGSSARLVSQEQLTGYPFLTKSTASGAVAVLVYEGDLCETANDLESFEKPIRARPSRSYLAFVDSQSVETERHHLKNWPIAGQSGIDEGDCKQRDRFIRRFEISE